MDRLEHVKDFLNSSPTPFHATFNIITQLEAAGFRKLKEDEKWALQPEGKYFLSRNNSAVIAFTLGANVLANPARIIAVHLDSPALKLKLAGAAVTAGTFNIPVDVYGGAIHSTWLDCPLGIAGRRLFSKNRSFQQELLTFPGAALLPSLAIHLNRSANNGVSLNPQTQMRAICGTAPDGELYDILTNSDKSFGETELYLYCDAPATQLGLHNELLLSPRIDNLASAACALQAITGERVKDVTQVVFFADNEEIGSSMPQGADSDFIVTALQRIFLASSGTLEDYHIAMARSRLLSADAAHALHPNFQECSEPSYAPLLNQGIALKYNVSYRYCTTAQSAAEFKLLCKNSNVPLQEFTNRADMGCGSTVGPALASKLGIQGVDVGIPILAMHSARETAGIYDILELSDIFSFFFNLIP